MMKDCQLNSISTNFTEQPFVTSLQDSPNKQHPDPLSGKSLFIDFTYIMGKLQNSFLNQHDIGVNKI